MTHDIVSPFTARQRPTGLTARIAGTVALVLLPLNGDASSSDSAAPRPVAPHAGPTAGALLRYLDDLPLRENGRCLTGQAVGANGSPDEARASFQDLPPTEANNAIPDVLDEVLWNLDLYRRVQTPDGGVGGRIESTAHPRPGEASWQESLSLSAYAMPRTRKVRSSTR